MLVSINACLKRNLEVCDTLKPIKISAGVRNSQHRTVLISQDTAVANTAVLNEDIHMSFDFLNLPKVSFKAPDVLVIGKTPHISLQNTCKFSEITFGKSLCGERRVCS